MREDLLVLVRRVGDDQVVSEGLRQKSSRSGKQLRRFVMRELELRSSMNFGVVNGVDTAIGEGC